MYQCVFVCMLDARASLLSMAIGVTSFSWRCKSEVQCRGNWRVLREDFAHHLLCQLVSSEQSVLRKCFRTMLSNATATVIVLNAVVPLWCLRNGFWKMHSILEPKPVHLLVWLPHWSTSQEDCFLHNSESHIQEIWVLALLSGIIMFIKMLLPWVFGSSSERLAAARFWKFVSMTQLQQIKNAHWQHLLVDCATGLYCKLLQGRTLAVQRHVV